MAAPLLFRAIPILRLRLHHNRVDISTLNLRQRFSDVETTEDSSYGGRSKASLNATKDPLNYSEYETSDYRKWKNEEEKILRDIEPITFLAKEIIHSNRYMDGERLTSEDESVVVEKLLAYHPHSKDKIGCGLDSIMVDRHPQFRHSRCLFVVRRDGGWIDFSYQKCLRAYIREMYPSYADRFIKEHFKRGISSG
ncbi:protein DCL homolog, chloroplastic [Impatiens glandulifera]|uniref:protein DCL homolog, chloroplastic n=1 Tax=Impatiens glandulifera TaxID=253017 RepID=UPI001FB0A30A|nr:protein DCL homolog, chloroplastic [Impatiens glandulifera]